MMNTNSLSRKSRISIYLEAHRVSVGLILATYGAFYLSTVIMGGWSIADWGKDVTGYPPLAVNTLLPHSVINPIFFLTSLPTLIIGSIMLCLYSIRGISQRAIDDKEHVAVLLTAFGFTYLVIGAWPLQVMKDFPWEWQKQIVGYGPVFAWFLYLLGLVVFAVGATSLYKHSIIHHRNNRRN